MDLSLIIPFITAFGLGSLITAFFQSWLQTKGRIAQRNFAEKKEAYIGLLEAYHKAAVEPSELHAKNFAFWQMRCDLVAPENVRKAIVAIIDSNDDRSLRDKAHMELKKSLRNDLAVTKQ